MESYINDASFYDIRKFFQGETTNGLISAHSLSANVSLKTRIRSKSDDEKYNNLIKYLRSALKALGDEKIVEKVYEYGFLLR